MTSWVTRRLLTSPRSHNLAPTSSLPAKDGCPPPAAFRPSRPRGTRQPLEAPFACFLTRLAQASLHCPPRTICPLWNKRLFSHTDLFTCLPATQQSHTPSTQRWPGEPCLGRTVVTRAAWDPRLVHNHECMLRACHKCLHSCPGSDVHECVGECGLCGNVCHVHEFASTSVCVLF